MKYISPDFFRDFPKISACFSICDNYILPPEFSHHIIPECDIPSSIVGLEQIHSGKVLTIFNDVDIERKQNMKGDGLVTTLRGVALKMLTADCAPVSLFNREGTVLALLHAGWRGVRNQIIENCIGILTENGFHCNDIIAYIGPCIGVNDYVVGEEFLQYFPHSTNSRGSRVFFNLSGEIARHLRLSGLSTIAEFPYSTFTNLWLYSFRRERNSAGRTESLIFKKAAV